MITTRSHQVLSTRKEPGQILTPALVAGGAQVRVEAALLRVLAGPELKSRVLSAEIKRIIAYHEVGHAVVMTALPHSNPVAKVQTIAQGDALGITVSLSHEDQYLMTRSALARYMQPGDGRHHRE